MVGHLDVCNMNLEVWITPVGMMYYFFSCVLRVVSFEHIIHQENEYNKQTDMGLSGGESTKTLCLRFDDLNDETD